MIKNPEVLRKFEDSFVRTRGNLSHEKALNLFEAMWVEGVRLGALPPKNL